MSARGNIVINDRATTPVAHTYTPDGDDKNRVHLYSEKGSVPAGNARFSTSLTQSGGRYRGRLKLAIPVVQTQTINGVSSPVVVRTGYVEVTTSFDSLSSTQERADAIGLMTNSLSASQTQVNDFLVNLSDTY